MDDDRHLETSSSRGALSPLLLHLPHRLRFHHLPPRLRPGTPGRFQQVKPRLPLSLRFRGVLASTRRLYFAEQRLGFAWICRTLLQEDQTGECERGRYDLCCGQSRERCGLRFGREEGAMNVYQGRRRKGWEAIYTEPSISITPSACHYDEKRETHIVADPR